MIDRWVAWLVKNFTTGQLIGILIAMIAVIIGLLAEIWDAL